MKKIVKMEDDHGSLEESFKNPSNEFRMMPFWFWNHEMVEKEVERQIRDHQDHGIGGEFIHPRHGRLTPYMGRRWLENTEHAADVGKELGMPMFLYDEDNWPSGPVGGKITGPYNPENRGKYLMLFDEMDFPSGEKSEYKLDYKQISPEAQFFAAIAVPEPENYPSFADVIEYQIDVSDHVKDNVFKWEAPDSPLEGNWFVLFFCVVSNSYDANMNGYIDILRKDTVKEFINETHQKYVDWFIEQGKEDYLGTVVPGIFTDEPSMGHVQAPSGYMLELVAFTPEMPSKFKEMYGYDFKKTLVSLFHDTGDISAKHRCDHWTCKTEMYANSFYKQIYDFCEKYDWRFTGHVNVEGNFPMHIFHQGDFFKIFKYMHYGGCDQLTEEVRPDGIEALWNHKKNPYTGMARDIVLASKLASSAAHLMGKPRVLVEAFGTSAWKIDLASCKRVNDYLIATGCDLFVPHDFAYSEDGYRKMDHPASFNYQPYYKHWGKLCDHNARLCATLNAGTGTLQPEVLFYYPSYGFYAEMEAKTSQLAELMGIGLTHNADCLFRQQIDFEIANEDLILGGELEDNSLKIRDERFKCLVLNPTTCISLDFAKYMKRFYQAGGKVLGSQLLPFKEPSEGKSEKIDKIMEEIFGITPSEYFARVQSKTPDCYSLMENSNEHGGKAVFISGPLDPPFKGNFYPQFEQAMDSLIPLAQRDMVLNKKKEEEKGNSDGESNEISTMSHPAYVMGKHKTIEGNEYYFLANTSRSEDYHAVDVKFNVTADKVELWDSLNGDIHEFKAWATDKDGRTTMTLDFPVYQSYLFVITPKSDSESHAKANPNSSERDKIPSDRNPIFTKPQNEVVITGDWRIGLNDYNVAMLYKNWKSSYEIKVGKAWGYNSTRTFTHSFFVEDKDEIGEIKLVIEGLTGDYGWARSSTDDLVGGDRAHFEVPSSIRVGVNGEDQSLSFDFEPEYIDPCWIVVDITESIKNGENEVKFTCVTSNHRTFHLITDPWRLIGIFEAEEREGIPYLKKPRDKVHLDDLRDQGFARYHGGFSYIKEVEVPEFEKGQKLWLHISDTTDCVEVYINGDLHEVLWNGWHTDLTEKVVSGEKVTLELRYFGIAQNMMQTNTFPTGLQGKVSLRIL